MTAGSVSAAQLNPIITFALFLTRQQSFIKMLFIWAAQLSGALVGTALMHFYWSQLLPVELKLFCLVLPNTPKVSTIFAAEATSGFLLIVVLLGVLDKARPYPFNADVSIHAPAMAIAAVHSVNVFIAGPISGNSMNPARALAPAILAGFKDFGFVVSLH
ncbi:Aquaporin [Cichlidogyrus casuarinus]|uniref:Aquaporin n=1 Tax=Cichlidogyrus casuarinus TaxID=1844966 RepID=A0ABD2PSH5_9PLAT